MINRQEEESMKHRKWIIPAAVILAGIIAGYFIIKAVNGGVSEEVASGIAYIKDLEKADTDEVEAVLALQRQQRLAEEREEKMRQVADGEIDVWSLFSDYALMGDSRAVGFEVFGFMPDDRVIAGPGWTIRDIEKNMATLQALNPSSIYLCFGLNDVSITRSPTSARILTLAVYLDGRLIQRFAGDGLIIATPTGSTGYSMSAGGPLVTPGVDLMLLTPICAHTPHAKPMVVPAGAEVEVELEDQCEAILALDGRYLDTIPAGGRIRVRQAEREARFIRMSEPDFLGQLKSKLMDWGK